MAEIGDIFYILTCKEIGNKYRTYLYTDLKIYKTKVSSKTPKRQELRYDPPLPKINTFYKFSNLEDLKTRLKRIEKSINDFLTEETEEFLKNYYFSVLGIKNTTEAKSKIVDVLKEQFLIGKMPLDLYEDFIYEEDNKYEEN